MTQLACVDATVTRREELSEHLVRVHVAGEQLRTMPWGEQGPGPRADSYVKLLIPPAGGAVDVDVADMARWRREFMAAPREKAGWMRTYTVRDATTVELAGQRVPELAIDVVLHGDPEHGMGPGAAWGDSVRAGDSARLLVPSEDSAWWAAWDDGRAAGQDVVVAGDETALPAISAIVDGVEKRVRVNRPVDGAYEPPSSITVAVEVPAEADAVPGAGPRALARAASCDEPGAHRVVLDGGTELVWTWLPRGTRERNLALELWLWERLPGPAPPGGTSRHYSTARARRANAAARARSGGRRRPPGCRAHVTRRRRHPGAAVARRGNSGVVRWCSRPVRREDGRDETTSGRTVPCVQCATWNLADPRSSR